MSELQFATIKPYQERCLRTQGTYLRDIRATEVYYIFYIVLHVLQHLPAPFFPLGKCCHGGDGSHQSGLIQLSCLHPTIEPPAQLFVGDHCPRGHQACHIEGLGGRSKRNTVLLGLLTGAGKGYMMMSIERHVTMNLIADDQDATLVTELGQALQGLPGPADASRVVRIAENQQAPNVQSPCHNSHQDVA